MSMKRHLVVTVFRIKNHRTTSKYNSMRVATYTGSIYI